MIKGRLDWENDGLNNLQYTVTDHEMTSTIVPHDDDSHNNNNNNNHGIIVIHHIKVKPPPPPPAICNCSSNPPEEQVGICSHCQYRRQHEAKPEYKTFAAFASTDENSNSNDTSCYGSIQVSMLALVAVLVLCVERNLSYSKY
jgi:hypothetical protein